MSDRAVLNPLKYAVKLLAQRPYSEKLLREKLRRFDYLPQEIESAIAELKQKRYLDDRQYAEDFVKMRISSRPRASSALVTELLSKGIGLALAKEVVDQLCTVGDEEKLARDLLARKQAQYASLEPHVRKRRLAALLARRGFRPDTIHRVLGAAPEEVE
jgi:regulatory protein